MKFVLLLLCASLCAHYVASSPVEIQLTPRQFVNYQLTAEARAPFWDAFQSFVKNIIDQAFNYLKEYSSKISEIISGIQKQIEAMNQISAETVQQIEKNVKQLMQAWQNETEIVKNCTEKFVPLMQQVLNVYQNDSAVCIQNATMAIQEISDAIQPSLNEIRYYIDLLASLVESCFRNNSNVFQGISCVIGKGSEVQANLGQVAQRIQKIISVSSDKGLQLVKDTGKCFNAAVDKYQTDMTQIQIEFKNCVTSGFWG